MKNFFATKWGIILTGGLIGITAALLQKLGNPGNMGVCVACFLRDISGALGLHRAAVVQYVRPEIIGFVLGSCVSAFMFTEFKPRGGSSPVIRFMLGVFAMIGALVFLGCPWRALLRLSAGDANAVIGLLGLLAGVFLGTRFLKTGYTLGKSYKVPSHAGMVMPSLMLGLLILMLFFPAIPGQEKSGVLFYSTAGPGAMHASLVLSLAAGLFIGFLAQRSRFCTMGALRDLILFRQAHLFSGIMTLAVAAFLANLAFGQFHPGMEGQPVAHTSAVWNFMGMALSGLAFCLAGGCPGRQLFLSGEGDSDAAIFVLGMLVGAAFSHNFALAASPKGIGPHSAAAVFIGFVFCLCTGYLMKRSN